MEPGRVCACPIGREALDLNQVSVPPSLPLEAAWKDNTKETERGLLPYNGSSAPLPLEKPLFPVSEQEGQPSATREYLGVIESLD